MDKRLSRGAHNPEIAGSSPAPDTNLDIAVTSSNGKDARLQSGQTMGSSPSGTAKYLFRLCSSVW